VPILTSYNQILQTDETGVHSHTSILILDVVSVYNVNRRNRRCITFVIQFAEYLPSYHKHGTTQEAMQKHVLKTCFTYVYFLID